MRTQNCKLKNNKDIVEVEFNSLTQKNPIQWVFVPKSGVKFTQEAFNNQDLALIKLWKEYKRFVNLPLKDKKFIYIYDNKPMFKARYKVLKNFFNIMEIIVMKKQCL